MTSLAANLRNRWVNFSRTNAIAHALQLFTSSRPINTFKFVSATRASKTQFWNDSPLGRSLKHWTKDSRVTAQIYFENRSGLSKVYNEHLNDAAGPDATVFVHDDVWLNDNLLLEKISVALRRFDVVGVAGNRRRVSSQPAWLFSGRDKNGFIWDWEYLSGSVAHGNTKKFSVMDYGPMPAKCEFLDGVFLAVRTRTICTSDVHFDECFEFDFYDMDFCRTARRAGLSLGTWPVNLIHESKGAFGTSGWQSAYELYLKKWRR